MIPYSQSGEKARAVIFDLYETLITLFDPAWKPGPSIAERLGVDEAAFSEAWRQSRNRRDRGVLDFSAALREISVALERVPDEALIRQLYEERLSDKTKPFLRIEDGVLQMVRDMRAVVKMGLISNVAPEEVAAWDGCALAPYFDVVVFSYQVGLMKPEAQIYHLACERLGVSPDAAIFVGDGASRELEGAASAGLAPYWATWFADRWPAGIRSPETYESPARFPRLKSPGELVDIVRRMK
jgi:putative hydrolase of the HAD superfamily